MATVLLTAQLVGRLKMVVREGLVIARCVLWLIASCTFIFVLPFLIIYTDSLLSEDLFVRHMCSGGGHSWRPVRFVVLTGFVEIRTHVEI